jgi:hypothetical protein
MMRTKKAGAVRLSFCDSDVLQPRSLGLAKGETQDRRNRHSLASTHIQTARRLRRAGDPADRGGAFLTAPALKHALAIA